MAHHPSHDPARAGQTTGYRLPDVLVADRAQPGLALALLGALVCSLGIFRACELKQELLETAPPSDGVSH